MLEAIFEGNDVRSSGQQISELNNNNYLLETQQHVKSAWFVCHFRLLDPFSSVALSSSRR
jgi:hypothetical protein